MTTDFRSRGSVGGVTINNNWMYDNPDLAYPEGHKDMSEEQLRKALRAGPRPELFDFKTLDDALKKLATCRDGEEVIALVDEIEARLHRNEIDMSEKDWPSVMLTVNEWHRANQAP
ncbi:hypothetical protein [Neptuniibacter sp. QD37_11]|uniref:hypothetical protein n=1 Tax=Neptuniibacter sp. QD37_11 TaxID=3398209 RepID=UPI0039F49217